VDGVARREDLRGNALERRQRVIDRARRDTLELDRVELLEAIERARLDPFAYGRDRAERDELAARSRDVDVGELVGRQTRDALDLRDHLVRAAVEVEAVDVVAAEDRGE